MSQAYVWAQLTQLLQAEGKAYGQLLDLLKEEWSALRTLNYQEVVEVARQKEDVLTRIANIEKERAICALRLRQDAEHDSFLQWLVTSTHSQSLPAKHALTELVAIGQQVKELSNKNSGLINRGMYVVQEAMNVVQEGLGLKPVYGETGQLTCPTVATSLNIQG